MEKMLINATDKETELRIALVDRILYDLEVECAAEVKKKGNIYKAVVTRREPSLDAVFVEYGSKRQGFLPFKEIAPEYLLKKFEEHGEDRPPITSLIREGQELLIQVDKEERGNKGAALTTYITLAGCYLVLMPNNPKSGGISRRIEGDDRDELKETLNALTLPEEMGLIIRTAGVGKGQEELQNDLDMLCNQWQAIQQAYKTQLAPCLIHQEGDVIIRAIRDNLRKSISEIIIDDQASYVKAKQYIEQVKPDFLPNLKLYNNAIPLFNFYQIESQIETAYQREVLLPSGGGLVIDRTEALVSIDINSAKATSGSDIETTALNTNLEAADEIARQLRLRDLGGLVVIDFIDMGSSKNQREVENRLKEALKADKARIQVGRISRFGLLEMSRQRLRLSLGENAQEVCPRCEGRGTVRSIQSHGLAITRLIEEEALKDGVVEIQVQLPPEMATFIMNEKRHFISIVEKRHDVHIVIISNPYMHAPHYKIVTLNQEQSGRSKQSSYDLIQPPEVSLLQTQNVAKKDEPVLKTYSPNQAQTPYSSGFLKRLWRNWFGQSSKVSADSQGHSHESGSGRNSSDRKSAHASHDRRTYNHPNRRRRSNNPNNPNQTQNARPNKHNMRRKGQGNVNESNRINNQQAQRGEKRQQAPSTSPKDN